MSRLAEAGTRNWRWSSAGRWRVRQAAARIVAAGSSRTNMVALHERYRISPGTDWWEHGLQIEALDSVAAGITRYDLARNGDDPPRKLSPYYDLERVRELIRGAEPSRRARARRFLSTS